MNGGQDVSRLLRRQKRVMLMGEQLENSDLEDGSDESSVEAAQGT